MPLSEQARERLADVVALQPTKNAELQQRWGLDSGSEVHAYLESELGEYYYRDEDSLIRATEEAAELVDVEPGAAAGGGDDDGPLLLSELEAQALEVVAGPDDRSESVVSVLQTLREVHDVDPSAEEVRAALRRLVRADVAEVVHRTVPTFRRTVDLDEVDVEVRDA